jgi:hypothetical protein
VGLCKSVYTTRSLGGHVPAGWLRALGAGHLAPPAKPFDAARHLAEAQYVLRLAESDPARSGAREVMQAQSDVDAARRVARQESLFGD